MRFEIHVKTVEEADEVRAKYLDSTDDVVIIVSAPRVAQAAERQPVRSAA